MQLTRCLSLYYLESLYSNALYAVHMLFIPYCLGNSLVQYCWIALCTIHTLFVLYCLRNSLVQYCWKVLCTIHALFVSYYLGSTWSNAVGLPCMQFTCCSSPIVFREFLLPHYFRKTLFLVHAILLLLFTTWAFCSFSFRVSSMC